MHWLPSWHGRGNAWGDYRVLVASHAVCEPQEARNIDRLSARLRVELCAVNQGFTPQPLEAGAKHFTALAESRRRDFLQGVEPFPAMADRFLA